jgi:hypothetical protein
MRPTEPNDKLLENAAGAIKSISAGMYSVSQ